MRSSGFWWKAGCSGAVTLPKLLVRTQHCRVDMSSKFRLGLRLSYKIGIDDLDSKRRTAVKGIFALLYSSEHIEASTVHG